MPLLSIMTFARRCLNRVLAFTRIRVSKKAGKKPLTYVTVLDMINREHKLMCVHGQKKSQYVREGLLQDDLVHGMVVACPKFQFTRSRANIQCSVYLYTTYGRMHTITCTYHKAERLRGFWQTVAGQSGV